MAGARRLMLKVLLAVTASGCGATVASAKQADCSSLAGLKIGNGQVTSATLVQAGAFVPPPSPHPEPPGRSPFAGLPQFCRVVLQSRPSPDSHVGVEVWLPLAGWNGRLQAVGNGALSGEIGHRGLAEAIAQGYAGVATDTGKLGEDGQDAIGHPERIADWGNRAIHEEAVLGKAMATKFYGSAPKFSYFASCSTGGREALVAAQYWPRDFNGIVVGDPANPMTRLQGNSLYIQLALRKDAASFISKDKWRALHNRVLAACDARDGVKDGLIDDPRTCGFDVKSLECAAGTDTNECLTAPQMVVLDKILTGVVNPRTGEKLYVGYPLGTVMNPGSAAGDQPDQTAINIFRMIFQDASWDYHTMNFDTDMARADAIANVTMSAVDYPKYKAFFANGGKMLMYHGWNDSAISPLVSIQTFEQIAQVLGGVEAAKQDVRLFMVPGMNHCMGGDGPDHFDKMGPISAWVEQGKAPDSLTATHYKQDVADRTRPLCAYPEVARYTGSGSSDEAKNFVCTKPAT